MSHTINVASSTDGRLVVWCSCHPKTPLLHGGLGNVFSLDGLNRIAHDHIEATDRTPIIR